MEDGCSVVDKADVLNSANEDSVLNGMNEDESLDGLVDIAADEDRSIKVN